MTLRDYRRILRERWRIIVAFVVLSTALAVLVTGTATKKYQATAQVTVFSNTSSDPSAQYQAAAFVQVQVQTYAELVTTPAVLKKVITDLNLPLTQDELRNKIAGAAPTQKAIIDITVTDTSASRAADIANDTASVFVDVIEDYTKVKPATGGDALPTVKLVKTQPGLAPAAPVSPNAALNIAVGLLLGLLIGAALAVARDILDNRIKDPEVLAKAANSTVMGTIIEDSSTARYPIASRAGNRNSRAENFRQLRANLQFANVDAHPRVIAITSSISAEGKSTVAINLASALSEAGFTVCLVDADLRRPTIAKSLGLVSQVGLTSVLIQQIDLSEAIQTLSPSLFVLSSGPTPPNPSEVLASSYVRDTIRSLLDKVDYVVLDTAPLLPVADGSEVAALADGTLLVARHGQTTDAQVKRAANTLRRVDAKILGVVLNRIPHRRDSEYGYTYYRSDNDARPAPSPKPAAQMDQERGADLAKSRRMGLRKTP